MTGAYTIWVSAAPKIGWVQAAIISGLQVFNKHCVSSWQKSNRKTTYWKRTAKSDEEIHYHQDYFTK